MQLHWFLFDDLDLSIFDQVIWNSAHGRWYEYSFNNYSYIVDHRSWLLLLFVPVYWLIADPFILLVVQACGLAMAAVPLYLISKQILTEAGETWAERLAIVVVGVYLSMSSTSSQATSEFHMLTFATGLLLWLWWSVMNARWSMFWILVFTLLLIREDLALVLFGVSVLLPIIYGRAVWRKSIILAGISVIWFVLMMSLGAWAAPDGAAKFFVFYSYLGDTPAQAIIHVFRHPRDAAEVILDRDHALYLWFLVAQLGFLPLLRLRYLIPAVLPLAIYLFIPEYILAPILKGHYAALVAPWLMLAAVHGWIRLRQHTVRLSERSIFSGFELRWSAPLFVVLFTIFHAVALNPVWSISHDYKAMSERNVEDYRSVLEMIGPNDSVLVTSRFVTYLAHRENLYYAQHIFTGKRHFSEVPYELPDKVDWLVLEQEEILRAGIYIPLDERDKSGERFQQIIDRNNLKLALLTEDLVVYGPEKVDEIVLATEGKPKVIANKVGKLINDDIVFVGWNKESLPDGRADLQLVLKKTDKHSAIKDDEHLLLTWKDEDGEVLENKLIALGYGLDPTHAWPDGGESQECVIHVPLTFPIDAVTLEASFGVLTRKDGPFFSMASVDPVLDESRRFNFTLDGFIDSRAQ